MMSINHADMLLPPSTHLHTSHHPPTPTYAKNTPTQTPTHTLKVSKMRSPKTGIKRLMQAKSIQSQNCTNTLQDIQVSHSHKSKSCETVMLLCRTCI